MKIKINVSFLCGIKKGTILETFGSQEDCYIVIINGEKCLINPICCEIVKEEKEPKQGYTTDFKKDCRNCEFDPVKCDKNCDNDFKYWMPIKKDIELPNEFYFKYFKDNKEYKAIKRDEEYAIYGVEDLGYYCDYDVDICKKSIKDKEWIIIEPPVVNEVYNEKQLEKVIEYNKLSAKIDNAITTVVNNIIDNKKVSRFIEVTNVSDFKVFIAKDKIVSIVEYEGKTHICTLDVAGDYIVIEKAEDIIKMLEE